MHHAAWVVAPMVLVGVLGFSAATKIGKGESLRSIIRNLALPDWILPRALARAIPGLELALAAGLLLPWRPVFTAAAVGSLVFMLAYWTLIARGMTLHPRPSCGCFGQAGEHQISVRTVLRNTLLVAAAGAAVALAASGRTLWSLLGDAAAGDRLWLALGALACVVTALVVWRPTTDAPTLAADDVEDHLHPAGDDDYVRRPTPRAVLHDPESGPVTLQELAQRRAQLLVFVNCHCASTREVMAATPGWDARFDLVDVRLVFSVPMAEERFGPAPPRALVDHAGLAWEALGLTESPSAVLLGVDGHLAGGPASGPTEVADFVDEVEEVLREALPEQSLPEPAGTQHAPAQRQLTGDR